MYLLKSDFFFVVSSHVSLIHLNESPPCTSFPSDLIPPGACNLLNSSTIYANNEVHLAEVDIYGFDYDYTLALYSNALNTMIYNKARTFLIENFKVCCISCIEICFCYGAV